MITKECLIALSNNYCCVNDMPLEGYLIRALWDIKQLQNNLENIDTPESVAIRKRSKQFENDVSFMLLKLTSQIAVCAIAG